MKKLTILLLLAFCYSSCGEKCENISEIILGQWSLLAADNDVVVFQEAGVLVDPDGVLVASTSNGIQLDDQRWSISGDSLLMLSARSTSLLLEANYNIESFDCDVITLESTGVFFDLERR